MKAGIKMRGTVAALLSVLMVGGLAVSPITARADDAKDKQAAGKGKEKKPDNIPIKIVDPIIVPDKGKKNK